MTLFVYNTIRSKQCQVMAQQFTGPLAKFYENAAIGFKERALALPVDQAGNEVRATLRRTALQGPMVDEIETMDPYDRIYYENGIMVVPDEIKDAF